MSICKKKCASQFINYSKFDFKITCLRVVEYFNTHIFSMWAVIIVIYVSILHLSNIIYSMFDWTNSTNEAKLMTLLNLYSSSKIVNTLVIFPREIYIFLLMKQTFLNFFFFFIMNKYMNLLFLYTYVLYIYFNNFLFSTNQYSLALSFSCDSFV